MQRKGIDAILLKKGSKEGTNGRKGREKGTEKLGTSLVGTSSNTFRRLEFSMTSNETRSTI